MKYPFLILLMSITVCCAAQERTEIKLEVTGKRTSIPFQITSVTFNKQANDTIGHIAKRKQQLLAIWIKNKESHLQHFLRGNFLQSDTGRQFAIEIIRLRIAAAGPVVSTQDTFQFMCLFRSAENPQAEPVYTFTASTLFGHPANPAAALTNYITQSLETAVEKFRDAYVENGAWTATLKNVSDHAVMPVKVNLHTNVFADDDSIACAAGRTLSYEDFPERKINDKKQQKISDSGSGKYVIIYRLSAAEANDSLMLNIQVKYFFHKANSWKPSGAPDKNWLSFQQGLFDLCTAYGRQFTNKIKEQTFSAGEYRTELNSIYNKVYDEYAACCDLYRKETGNGTNETEFLRWKKKISDLLLSQH